MATGPGSTTLGLLRASAAPFGLLRVPGVVVEDPTTGDWLNGYATVGDQGHVPLGPKSDAAAATDFPYWWQCGTTPATEALSDQGGVKKLGAMAGITDAQPFQVWTGLKCSSMDVRPGSPRADEQGAAAVRKLDAVMSPAVERELWTGHISQTAGLGNPYLEDISTVDEINAGAPYGFVTALAELEQRLDDTANLVGQRMIHAQSRVVTAWRSRGLVEVAPTRDHLVTVLGTVVVPGAGYPGTNPGPGGSAGYSWSYAYATGPVRVFMDRSAVRFDATPLTMDRETNVATIRAERAVLVVWDPEAAHIGVRINLMDEYGGSGS